MDKKETVILYRGQVESLLSLSSAKDIKTVLRAIMSYGMDGVEPEIPEHLAFGWMWFKHTIEQHNDQYRATVEARSAAGKASAEKRKNQQVSTKATSVDSVQQNQQVSTKATDKDKDKDLNRESVFRACAHEAERITGIYPKAKIGNHRKVVEAVIKAIVRESDRPGVEMEEAVFMVESGTIAYAEAVKKWTEKRYISDAEKFYESGMYNHDPATWEHAPSAADSPKKPKYNPADPSTWNQQ